MRSFDLRTATLLPPPGGTFHAELAEPPILALISALTLVLLAAVGILVLRIRRLQRDLQAAPLIAPPDQLLAGTRACELQAGAEQASMGRAFFAI